jgi:hypothetical protein
VWLQARFDLGRHVVLIVFGQDFFGDEAVAVHLAACDDALPLAEQVGQDARVAHRNRLLVVGEDEGDFQAARLAFEAAILYQAADPDGPGPRRFAGVHLRGAVVIEQVLVESLQCKGGGDADAGHDGDDCDHAFLSWCHDDLSRASSLRRLAAVWASASERRAAHQFQSRIRAVRP